jgi:regulation of enolase protein 1 (concanavalin A-like superfamily)
VIWRSEPPAWSEADGALRLTTAPKTDFWRTTHWVSAVVTRGLSDWSVAPLTTERELQVGVMAASPEGGGFDVVLRGFDLSADRE